MTTIHLLVVACLVGATIAAPRAQEVNRPGNGVTLPTVVKQVNPEYTPEAKDQHIEGVVILSAVVRADGTVGDVAVTESLDSIYGLDQQAVKAMKEWAFKPGTKNGKPVAVRIDVQMQFKLK